MYSLRHMFIFIYCREVLDLIYGKCPFKTFPYFSQLNQTKDYDGDDWLNVQVEGRVLAKTPIYQSKGTEYMKVCRCLCNYIHNSTFFATHV